MVFLSSSLFHILFKIFVNFFRGFLILFAFVNTEDSSYIEHPVSRRDVSRTNLLCYGPHSSRPKFRRLVVTEKDPYQWDNRERSRSFRWTLSLTRFDFDVLLSNKIKKQKLLLVKMSVQEGSSIPFYPENFRNSTKPKGV